MLGLGVVTQPTGIGISKAAFVLRALGGNQPQGLSNLVGGLVIGEQHRLESHSDGLLGHIAPVLEVHLNHGATVVELTGPHKVLQLRQGVGGVFGQELQVIESTAHRGGLRSGGPGAPDASVDGGLAFLQQLADLVFHGIFPPKKYFGI